MRATWIVAAALALIAAAATRIDGRTYEHARALGTRCSTCHSSTRPHASNLNAAGRFFQKHRTLEGFLSGAPDQPRPVPRGGAVTAGTEVYSRSCAACHGDRGGGTALAGALTGPPKHARTDTEIAAVIRDGIKGTTMAGFRGVLTPEEIDAVARYVAGLRKPGSTRVPESGSPPSTSGSRPAASGARQPY